MSFSTRISCRFTVVFLATLAFLSLGSISQAGQFSLDLLSAAPDIKSTGITVTYDAISTVGDVTTGHLLVEGLAKELDIDDMPPPNDFWIFPTPALGLTGSAYTIDIMLEVDTAAQTIETTSGTIEILGYLGDARTVFPPAIVPGSGTLLTGDIAKFGFTDTGILEFLLHDTGGDLKDPSYPVDISPIYGEVDAGIGVILDPVKAANGDTFSSFFDGLNTFTQDFSNQATMGQSDTFVPEPTAFVGLVSLLMALICPVWRRKKTA